MVNGGRRTADGDGDKDAQPIFGPLRGWITDLREQKAANACPCTVGYRRCAGTFPLPSPRLIGRIRASFLPSDPLPVANIKSAEKRAEQTIKRRARNMAARSKLRTAIKNVVAAVEAGDKTEAAAKLKAAGPVIDSMVNKGIIHRNKASRHKSHLNARVKEMGAE
jgi:small subunit ribosomal protein S20